MNKSRNYSLQKITLEYPVGLLKVYVNDPYLTCASNGKLLLCYKMIYVDNYYYLFFICYLFYFGIYKNW